jgi:hypothetical protein
MPRGLRGNDHPLRHVVELIGCGVHDHTVGHEPRVRAARKGPHPRYLRNSAGRSIVSPHDPRGKCSNAMGSSLRSDLSIAARKAGSRKVARSGSRAILPRRGCGPFFSCPQRICEDGASMDFGPAKLCGHADFLALTGH